MDTELISTSSEKPKRQLTLKDWINLPEELRAELIDGRIVYKAMPTFEHGRIQAKLSSFLSDVYDHK